MIEFNIDIGLKELQTFKNFTFDIVNNGSADLQVDEIIISSDNIQLPYIATPFIIIQNSTYPLSGYIKILNNGNSFHNDYIDFNISYTDEMNVIHTDVYRYQLNYNSVFYNSYTQLISINNIQYIKNMLILYFDYDSTSITFPNIILTKIDDSDYYIFPKLYKISDNKMMYVFIDNKLRGLIVNDNIKFFMNANEQYSELKRLSYRSI